MLVSGCLSGKHAPLHIALINILLRRGVLISVMLITLRQVDTAHCLDLAVRVIPH